MKKWFVAVLLLSAGIFICGCTSTEKPPTQKNDGETLFLLKEAVPKEVITQGVLFNVQVTIDPKTEEATYAYLDEKGSPFPDQEKWAKLTAGIPIPVEFSETMPEAKKYAPCIINWTIENLEYSTYYKTTYVIEGAQSQRISFVIKQAK